MWTQGSILALWAEKKRRVRAASRKLIAGRDIEIADRWLVRNPFPGEGLLA
jgi:hypothetical protein